jgi:hypothetical protein
MMPIHPDFKELKQRTQNQHSMNIRRRPRVKMYNGFAKTQGYWL